MMAIWNGRYTAPRRQRHRGAERSPDRRRPRRRSQGARSTRGWPTTLREAAGIKDTADSGKMAYDQMLAADNPEGNTMVQAASTPGRPGPGDRGRGHGLGLKIEVEGSDSLDNPAAVRAR